MQIYIVRDGQQAGPYSLEEIRAQLAGGTLKSTDMAWYDGAPDWLAVSLIPGLGVSTPPPMPPPMQQRMPFIPQKQRAESSGLAVASLVLGILAFFSAGLTAIPAIICGHIARSKIKRSEGRISGEGLALGGLITGYIGLFFLVAMMAGIALPVIYAVRNKADRMESVKCLSQAKQIALACRLYAVDHDGKYPDTLDQLVPTYLADSNLFRCPMMTGTDQPAMGYEYFGGKDSDPPHKVLLISKGTTKAHKKVVVYSDSSGVTIDEQEANSAQTPSP